MNGDILLDTNIIIGIAKNDISIVSKFTSFNNNIFVSTIVIGELLYSAELSVQKEQNVRNTLL